jgi:hypothetical protein
MTHPPRFMKQVSTHPCKSHIREKCRADINTSLPFINLVVAPPCLSLYIDFFLYAYKGYLIHDINYVTSININLKSQAFVVRYSHPFFCTYASANFFLYLPLAPHKRPIYRSRYKSKKYAVAAIKDAPLISFFVFLSFLLSLFFFCRQNWRERIYRSTILLEVRSPSTNARRTLAAGNTLIRKKKEKKRKEKKRKDRDLHDTNFLQRKLSSQAGSQRLRKVKCIMVKEPIESRHRERIVEH